MGVFDRLANVSKGWVSSKRNKTRDADLVGTAEKKLAQARDALAKLGLSDPDLDAEETRLRAATAPETSRPSPSLPEANSPRPAPAPTDEERPLAPEHDEHGDIVKRL